MRDRAGWGTCIPHFDRAVLAARRDPPRARLVLEHGDAPHVRRALQLRRPDDQSLGCRCVSLPDLAPSPNLSAPTLPAASLELKAEKQSAHSDYVRSVAFSPDGKTIVSGSSDKTLKVWDAGGLAPPILPMSQS